MPVVVAIHQPNFLPWLGYFDKVARSDVFVLLDSVQFPRSGHGEWMNRVRLLVAGEPRWVTVPIRRRGVQEIREVEIADDQPWRRTVMRTIESNYRRAPHFGDVWPLVDEILTTPTRRLAELNESGVRTIARALGLTVTRIVRSSELDVPGAGSDLLAGLTVAVGGTTYLSGGGADEYQREDSYAARGVRLEHQRFSHPTYAQPTPTFEPGLSIVDALMNVGIDGVRVLLERSR
jgi:hypothetical protein